MGLISSDQPVAHEVALDSCDRPDHARIGGRQEADERDSKKTGIGRLRAIRMHERVLLRIESAATYFGMDLVPQSAPARDRPLMPELLDRTNGAVECDPDHHFRMREMLGWAADFPNAVIGLVPDFFEMLNDGAFEPPARWIWRQAGAPAGIERIHDLAIDVELQLVACSISDAHGNRTLIARQPGELEFMQPAFSGNPIKRLDLLRVSGNRTQKPVAPSLRLAEEAALDERIKREGRIAQPTIAIIPIARATEQLRQRSRTGRDYAARLRMRERLERDQGTKDHIRPFTTDLRLFCPAGPERVDFIKKRAGGLQRGNVME